MGVGPAARSGRPDRATDHTLTPGKGRGMLSFRSIAIALAASALCCAAAAAAVPAGLKGAGADADKWVMDNADFVVVLNVKQLADSDVMKKAGGADAVREMIK